MPRTIHCLECGSTRLLMLNALVIWNVDAQAWVYSGNYDTLYYCEDCCTEDRDFEEREVKDG